MTITYKSHFGVYAIIPDAGNQSLLLVRKGLGCYAGLYDLPGGSMEPHELLEETLYREVHEETACHVTQAEQAYATSVLYPYMEGKVPTTLRHLGVIYKAAITGVPRSDAAGGDDLGCVWMKLADISSKTATPFAVEAAQKMKDGA